MLAKTPRHFVVLPCSHRLSIFLLQQNLLLGKSNLPVTSNALLLHQYLPYHYQSCLTQEFFLVQLNVPWT